MSIDRSNIETKIKSYILEATAHLYDKIKGSIISNYDKLISNIDTESVLKSNKVSKLFIDRLNDFKYIESSGVGIKFITPDRDNFTFDDDIEILRVVSEGVVGEYFELYREDYVKIISRTRLLNNYRINAADSGVVLIEGGSIIEKIESFLNKKIVAYPFSNSGPINLLDTDYNIDNELGSIIDMAINKVKSMK